MAYSALETSRPTNNGLWNNSWEKSNLRSEKLHQSLVKWMITLLLHFILLSFNKFILKSIWNAIIEYNCKK